MRRLNKRPVSKNPGVLFQTQHMRILFKHGMGLGRMKGNFIVGPSLMPKGFVHSCWGYRGMGGETI